MIAEVKALDRAPDIGYRVAAIQVERIVAASSGQEVAVGSSVYDVVPTRWRNVDSVLSIASMDKRIRLVARDVDIVRTSQDDLIRQPGDWPS
jgi:hypothetical protein